MSTHKQRGLFYNAFRPSPREIPLSMYKSDPRDARANDKACDDSTNLMATAVAGSAIVAGIATIATGGILPLALGIGHFIPSSKSEEE